MEQLRTDPTLQAIGVRVPSPKRYEEAGALVRLIHASIATEVLGGEDSTARSARLPNGLLAALRRTFAALLFVIALVVLGLVWMIDDEKRSYSESYGWRVGTLTVILIAAAGALAGVLVGSIWRLAWRWRESTLTGSRAYDHAGRLAQRELEYLRYSSAIQAKSTLSWKVGVLNISGEDQSSLTERQPTEADSVNRLRRFLMALTYRTAGRVIICVDELDKIDKPEDVVSIINGIKDLFHLPRVHVLVSVSTDAMHSFAARGILVRDVFDSAFDTVVEVRRLGPDESIELLSRRATRFSVPAMLFCHAWSGGHPRDLIRVARACVTYRARPDATGAVPLAEVVDAVLLSDVLDVLRATIDRLGSEPDLGGATGDDRVSQVLSFREHLLDENGPLHLRIRLALANVELPEVPMAGHEANRMTRALRPYLELAVCISEFFGELRTPDQWQSRSVSVTVVALAEAQTALSRNPDEATRAVRRALVVARQPGRGVVEEQPGDEVAA